MRRLFAHLRLPHSNRGIAVVTLLVWAVSVALLWNRFQPVPRATIDMRNHVEPRLPSQISSHFDYCFRATDSGFSPDGQTFVSSHTDSEAITVHYLWDATSGEFRGKQQPDLLPFPLGTAKRAVEAQLVPLPDEAGNVSRFIKGKFVVSSPDGRHTVSFDTRTRDIIVAEQGNVRTLRASDPDLQIATHGLILSPDGRTLVFSAYLHRPPPWYASLLQNVGLSFASSLYDYTSLVELWDVPSGSRQAVLEHYRFAGLYQDGRTLLTDTHGQLQIWDVPPHRPATSITLWGTLPACVCGLLLVLMRWWRNRALPQAPEVR